MQWEELFMEVLKFKLNWNWKMCELVMAVYVVNSYPHSLIISKNRLKKILNPILLTFCFNTLLREFLHGSQQDCAFGAQNTKRKKIATILKFYFWQKDTTLFYYVMTLGQETRKMNLELVAYFLLRLVYIKKQKSHQLISTRKKLVKTHKIRKKNLTIKSTILRSLQLKVSGISNLQCILSIQNRFLVLIDI